MATLKFGSFPRSGSHFFLHLTNCEWLDHRIEPLSVEQNVVVSIRNPLECVPSWITITEDKRPNRAEQVLEWYCAYYQKCKELNIFIIPFKQLISEPLACVHRICEINQIPKPTLDTVEFDFSTDFHSPTKDKSNYETIIGEMVKAPSYNRAMALFGGTFGSYFLIWFTHATTWGIPVQRRVC